jgi:protein-disulfide isomerase
MTPSVRAAFMVRGSGLDQFFRQRGMTEARINSCLADGGGLTRLADITRRASEQEGVQGTPTFVINGQTAEGVGPPYWPDVERRLRAAMGS